jgi:hypothetical protein
MNIGTEIDLLVESNKVRGYAARRKILLATFGTTRVIFTLRLTPRQVR